MHTPASQDEFPDLLDQAIFEVRDMLSAIETEGAELELGPCTGVFESREKILMTLHDDIRGGRDRFGGDDLACADLLERYRARIPFADGLGTPNSVKRQGL